MAKADYYACHVCDTKVFYDADLVCGEYDRFENVGDMSVICKECAKKYDVVIREKTEENE